MDYIKALFKLLFYLFIAVYTLFLLVNLSVVIPKLTTGILEMQAALAGGFISGGLTFAGVILTMNYQANKDSAKRKKELHRLKPRITVGHLSRDKLTNPIERDPIEITNGKWFYVSENQNEFNLRLSAHCVNFGRTEIYRIFLWDINLFRLHEDKWNLAMTTSPIEETMYDSFKIGQYCPIDLDFKFGFDGVIEFPYYFNEYFRLEFQIGYEDEYGFQYSQKVTVDYKYQKQFKDFAQLERHCERNLHCLLMDSSNTSLTLNKNLDKTVFSLKRKRKNDF